MKWYLKVVRDNYANFKGRARREEYWMFVLFNCLFIIGVAMISGTLATLTDTEAFFGLYVIYLLGIIIPSIAVVVRRLHDVNKSGWFYFIALIPLIGSIWLLVLLLTEGDKGPNQYGPDPKNPNEIEINEIGKVSQF
ncbi:DUF805 domain-containing protein [Gelidibacter mesophilus]|uniref:DUF805 domain-containing protein n=1 Tax=Gelidibacter mesophilus TaxID=169050 RepID=UPI0003F8B8D7|nr:DUF805 domain-containing protein [Gelidibacter mesophilus]